MSEIEEFLRGTLPINFLELFAAIAGTYYIRTIKPLKSNRYLVYFLWLTFVVEIIAAYAAIGYLSDYKYFSWIEESDFRQNYWLYNLFIIVSFVFYVYYFRSYIDGKLGRRLLKYSTIAYIVLSIINLFTSDVFFNEFSQFSTIVGTLLLILTIAVFYFELLKSDLLLKMKYFLPLYISIGALIFHLCITPIDIYSKYISRENTFFLKLKVNVYLYANIFLYSTYILGFIICSRKKKSY